MTPAPSTRRRSAVRALVVLAVLVACAFAIWRLTRPKPIPVALVEIGRGRVESTVANTRAGTVNACRRSRLAPPVGGQVAKLPVREGDRVVTDQILLELWNDDLRAAFTLASREAEASAARAEEACVTAGVAERDAARFQKLLRQGVATEEATDRATSQAEAQRAACVAAKAGALVSRARVDVARANLERTILRAPFPGTVAEVNGELGEFVTPSPVGVPTLPAVDLIDDSCLYISAPLDEVDAPAVQAGMVARVSLDAFPGRRFPGKVRRVAPYVLDVEKQARTVDVEVELENPVGNERLLAGFSADIEILLAARESVLRVPTQAVLEGHRVLVYREERGGEGVLEERTFDPGLSSWEFTEIRSGLEESERVVLTVDREGLIEGARVVAQGSDGQGDQR